MNEAKNISEVEKEGLKFLERDFNQCFQQMRHYDAQITEIIKFVFTAYTALIGLVIAVYQFGLKEGKNFSLPSIFALSIGFVIGIFLFSLIIRNRVYYVQVARYINEHRDFFLKSKPLGFENSSKIYSNYKQPPYFNWRSSQTFLYCIVASLNSTIFGILLYIVFSKNYCRFVFTGTGTLITLFIQIVAAILYLRSRENKSASKAVFGEE